MTNIIEVKGLTKRYKELTAVNHLDLEVKQGQILGLLGPNGSGKSTTINCILSLLSFNEGEIKIFNEEMSPEKYHIKEKIGVVFQEVGVFEELTVYENIDYFCGLYVLDKTRRKQLVQEAVDLVALNDFKKFRPKQLSGGLLRRLNIACGIAHKPELLFFDEPTVAVDPQSRNNILEGIKQLNNEGATVVYTSHYMDEVEQICDEIVIIDKGEVIAKGTADSLKNQISMNEKVQFESINLNETVIKEIRSLDHVLSVDYHDPICTVLFEKGNGNLLNLISLLSKHQLKYESLSSQRPTLNDVFLELTGKELRD